MIANNQIYGNTMPTSFLITLLVLHVFFLKTLLTEKKLLPYLVFIIVFGGSVYFSLPELTRDEAEEKVILVYGIDITEFEAVPVENRESWSLFAAKRAYFFEGQNPDTGERLSLLVNDEGDIIDYSQ